MAKFTRLFVNLITGSLLLVSLGLSPAQARNTVDPSCYIEASTTSQVSLGFPVAPERLNSSSSPRILVIPFRLIDTPDFQFSSSSREPFELAAEQISRISAGKTKVKFEFAKTLDIPFSMRQLTLLRDNQHTAYGRDESSSTFGFVRWLISTVDDQIDFTGFDAVYLQGSSNIGATSIAEAMMFRKSPIDPWFRPVETKEGPILNVVLTDAPKGVFTVAHEVLHLYGLTDLYGSAAAPSSLSIMAGHPDGMLAYEKWILGWLPDSQVTCTDHSSIPKEPLVSEIRIPRDGKERVHVIKLSRPGTALVIEFARKPYGTSFFETLAFFSLNNESRPPVSLHSSGASSPGEGTVLSIKGEPIYELIASQMWGSDFSLLVHDISPEAVHLKLIPTSGSIDAAKLLADARKIRQTRIASVQSKTQIKSERTSFTCIKGTQERRALKSGKCPKGYKKK